MILAINVGSTSIKYALFDNDNLIKSAKYDRIGESQGMINHVQAWEKCYQGISCHAEEISAVGYRVPVGDAKGAAPDLITGSVLDSIKKSAELYPECMLPLLEIIRILQLSLPKAKHVAVYDSAFFKQLTEKSARYPLSSSAVEKIGLKKSGLHGVSNQYALRIAQQDLGLIRTQRLIIAHLGATSSIAAIKDGVCVDTSGGLSPSEGLMAATRTGSLDPLVVLKMVKGGIDTCEIEKQLNEESGWLGISGASSDMRDLLFLAGFKVEDEKYVPSKDLVKNEQTIELSRLAIEKFTYEVAKYIGAYIVALGGMDALIFTGAIGAGSMEIRNMILLYFRHISDYELLIVQPNEEEEIRHQVKELLKDK